MIVEHRTCKDRLKKTKQNHQYKNETKTADTTQTIKKTTTST